jgi:hypothetical protein
MMQSVPAPRAHAAAVFLWVLTRLARGAEGGAGSVDPVELAALVKLVADGAISAAVFRLLRN